MLVRTIIFCIAAAAAIAIISGCGPRSSSAPGAACFSIFSMGPDNVRADNVTSVKVGNEVAVDISCAEKCKYNRDVNWGDGYWGEYMTHTYSAPGTYIVKYTCSTSSQRARSHSRKTRGYSRGQRFESAKTITVTQ